MRSILDPIDTPARRPFAALFMALSLAATACGGGSDTAAESSDSNSGATDSISSDGGDSAESESAESATDQAAAGVSNSIAWTAPDGMEPSAIAISPDGAMVAVSFAAPPGLETSPTAVAMFDAASGAELWRTEVEDGGLTGYDTLVFTSAGLATLPFTFDGVQILRFDDSGATSEVPFDPNTSCGQFLNGTSDLAADAFFTVIPGGFCRVDLTTGATIELFARDIEPGSELVDSIRFGEGGTLVASFADADFVQRTIAIDPTTLTAQGDAGQPEPADPGDTFGSQLVNGINLSSKSRVAQTPDGSVTVLLQPGSIDIVS